jgi:hypothetical protein
MQHAEIVSGITHRDHVVFGKPRRAANHDGAAINDGGKAATWLFAQLEGLLDC